MRAGLSKLMEEIPASTRLRGCIQQGEPMNRKDLLLLVPVLLLVLIATAAYATGWDVIKPNRPLETNDQVDLKVHEWGTFTSIAGQNGEAISWRPFGGPTDLPCFVDRFRTFKADIAGTVRMETPVLYFYGSRESTANVKVLFPRGVITEWYPKTTVSRLNNALEWRAVRVSPDAQPDFPVEPGQSHYYAARKTDAAPLRVGPQKEKFLFYRGVGSFPVPISAKVMDGGNILVKNFDGDAVSGVVLFENRGGKLRYQIAGTLRDEVKLHLEPLDSNRMALESDLERILVREGLFSKEAQAMIETWRDSWF